jgi:hypothetical protein
MLEVVFNCILIELLSLNWLFQFLLISSWYDIKLLSKKENWMGFYLDMD